MAPERILSSIKFWWLLCLFCAGILSWSNRHFMSPDGISYLDMASGARIGGMGCLVNGYWSPAYPALISLALFLFNPPPVLEFPMVHLVNFLAFVLALCGFTFFLKSWLALRETNASDDQTYIIPFSFAIFLWFTLTFTTVREVTPDLLLAAVIFSAAGICCRISIPHADLRWFVALGTILAIGYSVKTVMFPIGLLLAAVLFVCPPSGHSMRWRIILAGLVLLIVAAPLVMLISSRVGHLTIGETGRLNYAWYVNGLKPHVGWTGEPQNVSGAPEHPPRVLFENPKVLEFANPVIGTYPLWYEPSYWYAGAKAKFDLKQQLAAIRTNVAVYGRSSLQMISLIAGAFVLSIAGIRRRRLPAVAPNLFWLLVWPVAVCSLYALVHVEPRLIAPFLVLFWLAIYRSLWQTVTNRTKGALLAIVLCTLFVPTTMSVAAACARTLGALHSDEPDYQVIGAALHAAGVHRGDRVASLGEPFEAYYARYAGVRFVAEIDDALAFERLSVNCLARIKDRLAAAGVKALVSQNVTFDARLGDWQDVRLPDARRFRILLLPARTQTK